MNDKQPIEAEVVPNHALAVRKEAALPASISELEQNFALAVRQRELLADYIKKQLIPGKHFYEVRGQDKKSLTKEGAEIILLPHSLAPDYEMVSGPEQPPEGDQSYQITVKCTLRKKGDPNSFVGSGIGSASSHRGYWNNNKWEYKLRQNDRGLCYNATVKMAQKSAMIAATINSTAASEFFTQDMGPGEGGAVVEPPPPRATASQPKPAKVPPSVESCRKKMVKNLSDLGKGEEAFNFLIKIGWMLPTEKLHQLEDRYVPRTPEQWQSFLNCLENFISEGDALMPYEPNHEVQSSTSAGAKNVPGVSRKVHAGVAQNTSTNGRAKTKKQLPVVHQGVSETGEDSEDDVPGMRPEGGGSSPGLRQAAGSGVVMQETSHGTSLDFDSKDAQWRKLKMTHGKNKGIPLGDLPKNYLFGLWANFEVEETWTDKEGNVRDTKPDILAGMRELRAMLDEAAKHYKFTKKEDK